MFDSKGRETEFGLNLAGSFNEKEKEPAQKAGNDKAALQSKVGQEQIHGLLFGEQLSWQQIIYDLINSEQLDPWDIDLALLTNKYLERVREMEEADLFVSSKVLFAVALLLRIKSEILLNHYIPSLDAILFGKEEEKKYVQERIELEEEVPGLVLRTPLPRFRKVSLQELMAALSKAVKTENRRIKKVVTARQYELEAAISLPRAQINIKDRIKEVYEKIKKIFFDREEKVAFSEIAGEKKEERISTFVPLLYLDMRHKVLLEQEKHLDEIYIWLKHLHDKKYKDDLEKLKREVEEEFERLAAEEKLEAQMEKEEAKKKYRKKTHKKVKEKEEEDDEEETNDKDANETEI